MTVNFQIKIKKSLLNSLQEVAEELGYNTTQGFVRSVLIDAVQQEQNKKIPYLKVNDAPKIKKSAIKGMNKGIDEYNKGKAKEMSVKELVDEFDCL